jgi:hypothetical protein
MKEKKQKRKTKQKTGCAEEKKVKLARPANSDKTRKLRRVRVNLKINTTGVE